MNILFLTFTDPREISYGGQQRTHVLWKGLCSLGEVWTVVPVSRLADEERDDCNRIYKFCLEKRYSPGWFIQRLWSRFLPSATVPWGISLEPIRKLGIPFDVVVSRFLNMAGRTHPWKLAPMYVDVDDTPTVDYGLVYPRNRIRLKILKLWQRSLCRHARHLWVPDPGQMEEFRDYSVSHLPNIPLFPEGCDRKKAISGIDLEAKSWTLLFIGYLAHKPNQVAIDWFLRTFWHDLKKRFPKLRYRIAGGGLPVEQKEAWSKYEGVELLGYVEDLDEVYASGAAMLTPMRIGSGTCIKVLEALGRNIPVISTLQGLRGIPPRDYDLENGIAVFDDFWTLTRSIDTVRAMRLVANDGRSPSNYIVKRYSQRVVNKSLIEALCSRCAEVPKIS